MHPKPVRAEKPVKGLAPRCECGCKTDRHDQLGRGACLRCGAAACSKFRPRGLNRGKPLRSGPRAPLAGEDAGRLEFSRHGVCVGLISFADHVCVGDLQASHERNPQGQLPTGAGRKEDPRQTCTMCAGLHLNEWEARAGHFAGWSNDERHNFMAVHTGAKNAEWDALPDDQHEWWAQQEAINRKRRAEALRSAS